MSDWRLWGGMEERSSGGTQYSRKQIVSAVSFLTMKRGERVMIFVNLYLFSPSAQLRPMCKFEVLAFVVMINSVSAACASKLMGYETY